MGSVMPRSVPASFAVKPDREVVLVCSGLQDGDRGQGARCVSERKMTFFASGCRRNGTDDVLDVVDEVGRTKLFSRSYQRNHDVASSQVAFLQQALRLMAL